MNLLILFKDDFIDENTALISGRRFSHIRNIHRSNCGDSMNVGLLNGKIGTGILISISKKEVTLKISLDYTPVPPIPVQLIVALPRPNTLKKVLQSATSMGIKKMYFIASKKVEKSYWQSSLLKDESLKKHLILGLEQAEDTILPELHFRKYFKPFVEDEIPQIIKGTDPILPHPGAKKPCPSNIETPVTLAIGPEGGFTDYEVELLSENGFQTVNLGKRILRVEYAVSAVLGRLMKL
ncbi:MAG: 16S rRNA (uracil(1498)-N(3))-methyltransferase [Verrucomicrobiota bacterium]|nr:16S rRNA (uracil(1498)-N(3))-methyltransferase [Verrucomicrobiota bacterium]